MTEFENFMLTMCFSTAIGLVLGCWIALLGALVDWIKEKVKQHKEKKNG